MQVTQIAHTKLFEEYTHQLPTDIIQCIEIPIKDYKYL
jgi:hypothetical protein